MILKELCDLYERLEADPSLGDAVPPAGFSSEKVGLIIEIDRSGAVVGARYAAYTANGAKPSTRFLAVPEHDGRTSGVYPFFLCDSPDYLLGYTDVEGLDEARRDKALLKAAKKREASAELHRSILEGCQDAAASAVLEFFEHENPLEGVRADVVDTVRSAKGFCVLKLDDDAGFVHERPAVRKAWLAWRERGNSDESSGQCAVTGETGPLARKFPQVSGIPGAQSAGASLVSFNCDAFTSYGKEQAFNASISQDAATEAGNALKYLYRDSGHHVLFGDMAVLFWSDRRSQAEDDCILAMLSCGRGEDAGQTERIQGFLMDMRAGRRPSALDLETRYCVLGLSPNAARLSVRFFFRSTFGELVENFSRYLQDIAMEGCRSTSIFYLMRQTAFYDSKKSLQENLKHVPQTVMHDCARAMLQGAPFPRMIFTSVLARMRSDHGDRSRWDLGERASLLKAYLNRHGRMLGNTNATEREMTMSLDESNTDQGYVLGRLFALIENVQANALNDVNSTVTDRFIGAASTTPARCFSMLLRNMQHNMGKLRKEKPGLAVNREKQVEDVIGLLNGADPLPATLDEEAQGRFFIGYYQQREKLFRKAKDKTPDGEEDVQTELAYEEE